jgi:hypothetical protein
MNVRYSRETIVAYSLDARLRGHDMNRPVFAGTTIGSPKAEESVDRRLEP